MGRRLGPGSSDQSCRPPLAPRCTREPQKTTIRRRVESRESAAESKCARAYVRMTAIQLWFKVFLVAVSAGLGAGAGHAISSKIMNQTSIAEVEASIDRGSVFRLYY